MDVNTNHARKSWTDSWADNDTRTARRPLSIIALAALLALLAIGAFQGGIAMLANPVDPLGMSPSYLEGSPVGDYFWPGMFLIGIAVASLVTATGLVFRWTWSWARPIEAFIGYSWPWLGAVSTGAILLIFEIVELFMIPFHPIMHPLLITWSAAIVALASLPSARAFLRVHPGAAYLR